jgi:arylsulfatase A-like enzyme
MITRFLLCFAATLLACALCAKSPNLIIILTDDQGYNDVGFNGCTDIPTPHLDKLADDGVIFTDGYVSYPVCGPSRAGLLTGRYQDRFGFTTNPTIDPGNPDAGLPKSEENIAEVLNKANYSSAIIGKWHMGSHPSNHPLNRGFEYFYGFLSGGHNYFPTNYKLNDLTEVSRIWEWYNTRLLENFDRINVQDDYLTDVLTDAATDFIDAKAKANQHFMLYLAYNAPHAPLQATEKYLSRFPHIADEERRTYAAMVSCVDDGVGRVMESLRRNNVEEDTIVVFLSDNGGALTKNASDNGSLRGAKSDLFEGGIRVPFAMQWKSIIPAGQIYSHPVISLDIMGTITALAGVKIAEDRPLDGVNLLPYLTGENKEAPHDQLFWRKWEQQGMCIRDGDTKLVANTQRHKNSYQLFNVENDLSETKNLRKQNPEKSQQLLEAWEAWNDQLKDRTFPTLMTDKWWERL